MTRIMRWFNHMRERWLGQWYEGPEMPERLAQVVVAFANDNRHATRGDWTLFAVEHAREVYRSAYRRGYEYAERDPEPVSQLPEEIMGQVDPNWAWNSEPIQLQRPLEVVGEEPPGEGVLLGEQIKYLLKRSR